MKAKITELPEEGKIEKCVRYLQRRGYSDDDLYCMIRHGAGCSAGLPFIVLTFVLAFIGTLIGGFIGGYKLTEIMSGLASSEATMGGGAVSMVLSAGIIIKFVPKLEIAMRDPIYDTIERIEQEKEANNKSRPTRLISPEEREYTKGATCGALWSAKISIPKDPSLIIAQHLDRKDGANLAGTCYKAAEMSFQQREAARPKNHIAIDITNEKTPLLAGR